MRNHCRHNANHEDRTPAGIAHEEVDQRRNEKARGPGRLENARRRARFSSGQTSATSAAPAAHSPPMPRAVRNR